MNEILNKLKAAGLPLRKPASSSELDQLSALARNGLPGELIALYSDHGGMERCPEFPMRLLSPSEAMKDNQAFHAVEGMPFLPDDSQLLCWHDDNSNYAGVFLGGEMQGRVFILDHEEPNSSPRFFSTHSFYERMLVAYEAGKSWNEMGKDYPVPHVGSLNPRLEEDSLLAKEHLMRYLANPNSSEGKICAYRFLALLPPLETSDAVQLLDSQDMWIQEEACKLLGIRRFGPAIERLAEVARSGKHNGRIQSILALKRINNSQANRQLQALRNELGSNYEPYFRG